MIYTLTLAMLLTFQSTEINFGSKNDDSWTALNDGVMGGRSIGKVGYTDTSMQFTGSISFQNNGGFASVRSRYQRYNLSKFDKLQVRYRSTGQTLGLVFETDQRWFIPNYKVLLPITNNQWQTVTFPLSSFKEYRIGEPSGGYIRADQLLNIIRLGIITADKKEGAFIAEIDKIIFIGNG